MHYYNLANLTVATLLAPDSVTALTGHLQVPPDRHGIRPVA